ncbi:hypothetical protein Raf01_25090 [Rugosimonospora africana]|uniref:Uncharacterized protein n=1 Tax=Rugosimonospora africana TaxID=556532 RepID=A0A8J3VPV3_9ACTN|nr:hypothetical protein Raf01_25090 [Rugosimonospora africana]
MPCEIVADSASYRVLAAEAASGSVTATPATTAAAVASATTPASRPRVHLCLTMCASVCVWDSGGRPEYPIGHRNQSTNLD